MGFLDLLKKGASLLAPHVGKFIGWGAQKLGGWAMKRMEDAAANQSSVFGRFIRNYGPQAAEWMGSKVFQDNIRKHGQTLDNTAVGKLIRFPDGMSAGTAMLEANNRMMNFLRNGGRAPTNNIAVDRKIENGEPLMGGKNSIHPSHTQTG